MNSQSNRPTGRFILHKHNETAQYRFTMKSNVEETNSLQELLRQARSYAYGFTRNMHDAEDLVQQAWVKLARKYGEVTDRRLLYRAVRNLFIDGVRRSKIVQFDALENRDFALGQEQSFGGDHDIDSVLEVLNDNERRYLRMNVVDGYTATEIAEKTGVPRGTILSHTHRARKKLQARFDAEMAFRPEETPLAAAS